MFETLIIVAALGGPCDGDACRLPVLGAPIRATVRIVEAKPVRKIVVGLVRAVDRARPVRRLIKAQPVRRLLRARPVRRLRRE